MTNLVWASGLSKVEETKAIILSFSGPLLFIAKNINAEEFIANSMQEEGAVEGCLQALEYHYVGRTQSDLTRNKLSINLQEKQESILIFA